MGVQGRSNLEQGCEFVIASFQLDVTAAKVLHRAGPVDTRHKAIKAQARSPHHFRRTDVESIIHDVAWLDVIDTVKQENASQHGERHASSRNQSGAFPRIHFKFLRSKISTAPLRAIAV